MKFVFNQEYTLLILVFEFYIVFVLFIKQMSLVFCIYSKNFIDGACYKFYCLFV